MANPEKTRETRLRRIATHHGYRLAKSRARDPASPEYGGYMIIDNENDGCVHGFGAAFQYTASLDSIEEFLGSLDAAMKSATEGRPDGVHGVKLPAGISIILGEPLVARVSLFGLSGLSPMPSPNPPLPATTLTKLFSPAPLPRAEIVAAEAAADDDATYAETIAGVPFSADTQAVYNDNIAAADADAAAAVASVVAGDACLVAAIAYIAAYTVPFNADAKAAYDAYIAAGYNAEAAQVASEVAHIANCVATEAYIVAFEADHAKTVEAAKADAAHS
jgi:hypothetical protein